MFEDMFKNILASAGVTPESIKETITGIVSTVNIVDNNIKVLYAEFQKVHATLVEMRKEIADLKGEAQTIEGTVVASVPALNGPIVIPALSPDLEIAHE